MNRTIIVKPFVNNSDLAAIWPDQACVFNTSIEEFPDVSDLTRRYHFAEREFGSTHGVGSGPFFTATYVKDADIPIVNVGGVETRVVDMYQQQHYTVETGDGVLDLYEQFTPSWVDGRRIIAFGYVYMKDGRFYSNELGYYDIDDPHTINAAQSYGFIYGMRGGWNSIPYPSPDIRNDPNKVLSWLISLVPGFPMNARAQLVWQRAGFEYGETVNVPATTLPLKYGEHQYYLARSHPDLTSPFSSPGHLHPGLFSAAYYAAQDNLPQLLSNTFQNLLELGETVVSFANGIDLNDLKNLKTLSGNAWLAYRYQYNTTLSDLEELESAIERFDNLSRMAGKITSYGHDSDSTGVYHCAIAVDPEQILNRSLLKRLNLRPTLANVWDMIPYSFIVDWFTNIGDVLAAIDKWLDTPSYGSVRCWYSYTNNYRVDDGAVTCYFRFEGKPPLLPFWSMDYSHSGKIWAMRATDIVSLLT